MQTIFSKILYEIEHKKDTCLVTVVADQGSAPRGSGARMLVGANGRIRGTIGGGAIEKRAEEMAVEAIRSQKGSFLHDFTLRRDAVEDLGMVCGGDVTVLFNYIRWDDPQWTALSEALLARAAAKQKCWLVCPLDGTLPALYDKGERLAGSELAPLDAFRLNGEKPQLLEQRLFAERISIGERLIIFGAGHIARSLAPLAVTLGFRPVIFDNRPEYAAENFFPGAEQVICAPYEDIAARVSITEEDYVVIMTNGHSHDLTVQQQVMDIGTYAYLGVIGSRAKTAVLNKALLAHGIAQEALDGVHTPIGTNIRAVTPEEIAVSIAGELILVRANRREGK